MNIGVPKEIKNNESRVGLTPANVTEYLKAGHHVYVQNGAGIGSGFTDDEYVQAGAKLTDDPQIIWQQEMLIKVKEPLASEYAYFHPGLILFTYLHLAAEPELTKALLAYKVTAYAYETVQIEHLTPLLRPMSEVAGRRSITVGANLLETINGGKGILIGGSVGVKPANVTIIGGGIAGFNAATKAVGLGANVTIIELDEKRLRFLHDHFQTKATVLKSTYQNIFDSVITSDLLVSTILIPGAKAPKLVTEEMVKQMEAGSVIVDVAIDQGGSVETIDRITTHDEPTFVKHGVLHYSVANMPGAVARTSTLALTNATLNYGLLIANNQAQTNKELQLGLNTHNGEITNEVISAHFK